MTSKRAAGWGPEELKQFENRLLGERRRAVEQIAQFDDQLGMTPDEAAGELTSWRFHMADVGSESFEREQQFLMASREGRLLWLVDQALRRLYHAPESFGLCEECGKRIGFERLDAIPYVSRCVACKGEWESHES